MRKGVRIGPMNNALASHQDRIMYRLKPGSLAAERQTSPRLIAHYKPVCGLVGNVKLAHEVLSRYRQVRLGQQ